MPDTTPLLTAARDLTITDLTSGRDAYDTTTGLICLSNTVTHRLAVAITEMDRLGVAAATGGKTKKLLITMGLAPAVADRLLRIGTGLARMALLGGYAEDGVFAAEHLDAIISGVAHVCRRAPDGLCDVEKYEVEQVLIAQAMSGATPTQISEKARALGNQYAADTGGLPAAEDRSINELTISQTADGRIQIRGDVDIITGEKLLSAITSLSGTRPEPDGSPDTRSTGQRHADALEAILEAAAVADTTLLTPPKTHVSLLVPADTPEQAVLGWTGPVTAATAALLACDAAIGAVIINGDTVPLQMGRDKRLFPSHLRKAIIIRDTCCIKCGARAGYTHVHHINFWAEGGATDLDNGCLLCPSCHTQIHHGDWQIIMGADRHPWLIPPASIDPTRTPLPAYNRRTLTLDDRIAA
ncbi:DUF222 domain-containing protein [Gordonia sp. NPDC003424]